jgi:hypothetical protein
MHVQVVWHIHHADSPFAQSHLDNHGDVPLDDRTDDAKLIGIYRDQREADAAIARTRLLPGFSDEPECFIVETHTVDEDNWTTGFMTV